MRGPSQDAMMWPSRCKRPCFAHSGAAVLNRYSSRVVSIQPEM